MFNSSGIFRQGFGYADIGRELDISKEAVKSFCRRNGLMRNIIYAAYRKDLTVKTTTAKIQMMKQGKYVGGYAPTAI